MSTLLAGLLSAAISTNVPVAVSNLVAERTGLSIPVINTNDPVEREYYRILEDDDAAEKDVLKWSDDASAAANAGTGKSVTLQSRVRQRLDGIRAEYDTFIARHPDHVNIRLAYGSFLNDIHDDPGAVAQWTKATQLAPNNPAAWNNLANYYEENGPVSKAFECYEKAIALNPNQQVYYHNLGAALYMFRSDASAFYHLNEQQVFDKALGYYRKAIALSPGDFILFSDYAESFYGCNPPRWQDGLSAWKDALKIARDDAERQGVHLHLARINIKLGNYDDARKDLALVTGENYAPLKKTLTRNLDDAIRKSVSSTPLR